MQPDRPQDAPSRREPPAGRPREGRRRVWIPGRCESARRFEEELGRVASSAATVLLEGESGSGKGAAARRLHALSPRREGPFVEVALAALSATLLESELFGHEPGAFTGAAGARKGRFELAEGGTIVLDGVEHLPEGLQVKLLRVLQERVVEPLGAERPRPVDVRIVATCGRDLGALVRAGAFREDLYFRLAVVVLSVPPLRTRREDLPELVERLGARIAERARVAPRPFGSAALERLAQHGWPGNLRELENAIERVLVLRDPRAAGGADAEVAPEELDFLGLEKDEESVRLAREALALGLGVDDMGHAMIEEALAEERGNASAAARRLGLTRRALEYRRKRAQEQARGEPRPEEEQA